MIILSLMNVIKWLENKFSNHFVVFSVYRENDFKFFKF